MEDDWVGVWIWSSGRGAFWFSSCQSKSKTNKKTAPSLKQVRTYTSARKKDLATFSLKKGVTAYNKREAPAKKSLSSSQNAAMGETGGYELIAIYGYDPNNRRILRNLAEFDAPGEEWWYTYDGWQVLEEYENTELSGILNIRKVNFGGIGIDEHLGYALLDPNTGNWTRYILSQDTLGTVHALLDPATGTALKRYEYNPYGERTVYRQVSGTLTPMPAGTLYASTYGFTGRRHDTETGFVYYRNRYYCGSGREERFRQAQGPDASFHLACQANERSPER